MWIVAIIAIAIFIMNPRTIFRILLALLCAAVALAISENGWFALIVFVIMAIPLSFKKK